MIARVRFLHPSAWWSSHDHWPNLAAEDFDKLTGTTIEIFTENSGLTVKCGGRAWFLTEESRSLVESILGFTFPGNVVSTCEHAIEIGD